MSRFTETLGKRFKGSSDKDSLPKLRFTPVDNEVVQIFSSPLEKYEKIESDFEESSKCSLSKSSKSIQSPSHESGWLTHMKGRIAKTVEEKYSEYKIEKEKKKQISNNIVSSSSSSSSPPFDTSIDHESQLYFQDSKDEIKLNHSKSDNLLVISEEIESPSNVERKKFNFISFRSKIPKQEIDVGGTFGEGNSANKNPSYSLRQRVFGLMNKTPGTLHFEEEFTELLVPDSSEDSIETAVEADEHFQSSRPASLFDEEESPNAPNSQNSSPIPSSKNFFFLDSLPNYYSYYLPFALLLLFQILPLHYWISGCLTGLFLGLSLSFYIALKIFNESKSNQKTTHKGHNSPYSILIQEQVSKKEVWMNLWPSKYGSYDAYSYDIRQTVSVFLSLYGSWLEMYFPKRNISLRRNYDEILPEYNSSAFYEHREIIDLSSAQIRLLPENLSLKRLWSKKYPIEIKTNVYKDTNSLSKPDVYEDALEDNKLYIQREREKDNDSGLENKRNNNNNDEEVEKEKKKKKEFGFSSEDDSKTYYLFARSGREKEEWYSRLRNGSKFLEDMKIQNLTKGKDYESDYQTFAQREEHFKDFMKDYLQAQTMEEAHNKYKEATELDRVAAQEHLAFFNIYIARLWFDFHKSKEFIESVREKITQKLLKIKIAQYFKDVSVSTLELGQRVPIIKGATLPWQNDLGLWVDLELEYEGLCQATVETQGLRLPSNKDDFENSSHHSHSASIKSDEEEEEEDSGEEDDEFTDNLKYEDEGGNEYFSGEIKPCVGFRARMLESLLKSELLAKVAASEWVKKNITEKNITLKLQLIALKGTLTLNFPPSPSDRIWYGFRTPPCLEIILEPIFGGHKIEKYESTFSAIMRLLEKRLKQEFMKVLVFPNMDDEIIPFMDHVTISIRH